MIGNGLDVLPLNNPSRWQLRRTDGQAFEHVVDTEGRRVLADPIAYPWLWFHGTTAEGDLISVPAIDVPPEWIEWSDDARTIFVDRAPKELGAHVNTGVGMR